MSFPAPVSPSSLALDPDKNARGILLLLVATSAAIPLTLLWDYSWESTIGIDLVWSPPHVANYLAVGLACVAAMIERPRSLGALLVLWGGGAFLTAVLLDGWWQISYGLAAGIWGPAQLLKAVAMVAIQVGVLMACAASGRRGALTVAAAALLTMISVVSLATLYPNRQQFASFFQVACGAYPLVLAALSVMGRQPWPATRAALGYFLLWGAMVWLLPLFPGTPQIAPIFNPRDHLLPPPFPLLLFLPAMAIDGLARRGAGRGPVWRSALESGLAFFLIFVASQWLFSSWLLTPAAANPFFAGGGEHWPFYLQIAPEARTAFWTEPGETLNLARGLTALALAIGSAFLGQMIGRWLQTVRR